jgi:hypothetical protein
MARAFVLTMALMAVAAFGHSRDSLIAVFLGVFVLGSIALANSLLDRGIAQYLTRKVGHVAAGLAFLATPLVFEGPGIPLALCAAFTVIMLLGKHWAPHMIRGVGGTGRGPAMAEVWYPFSCAVAVFVGWRLLHNPWLGVLPTLFLGFGDAITGAMRSVIYKREVKGLAGSLAMLALCSVLSLLVQPYWIGLAGAITATFFERISTATAHWDDNASLTLGSTIVMGLLYVRFAIV